MCLAVPGKILQINPLGRATVDMLGVQREVSLRLVRELPDLFDEDLAQAEAAEELSTQAEPSLDDGGAA